MVTDPINTADTNAVKPEIPKLILWLKYIEVPAIALRLVAKIPVI